MYLYADSVSITFSIAVSLYTSLNIHMHIYSIITIHLSCLRKFFLFFFPSLCLISYFSPLSLSHGRLMLWLRSVFHNLPNHPISNLSKNKHSPLSTENHLSFSLFLSPTLPLPLSFSLAFSLYLCVSHIVVCLSVSLSLSLSFSLSLCPCLS